jgi:hypothetical protein
LANEKEPTEKKKSSKKAAEAEGASAPPAVAPAPAEPKPATKSLKIGKLKPRNKPRLPRRQKKLAKKAAARS